MNNSCSSGMSANDMFRNAVEQHVVHWNREFSLKCFLCKKIFIDPITTPCGHTFCKLCFLRFYDTSKFCPICLLPLPRFNAYNAKVRSDIKKKLSAMYPYFLSPMWELPENKAPILVHSLGLPHLQYNMLVKKPAYFHMIREILFTGYLQFGIISSKRIGRKYGTMLRVYDAVSLENGGYLLTTRSTFRFSIQDYDQWNGYEVGTIKLIVDDSAINLQQKSVLIALGKQTYLKAVKWLNVMDRNKRTHIENTFGKLPDFVEYDNEMWWTKPDGPAWHWWMVAVLPFSAETRLILLTTQNLLKRLRMISSLLILVLENEQRNV